VHLSNGPEISHDQPFKWAVIGGGPAGIAAIGKLIDHGYSPHELLWIDPTFTVGDLGKLWQNVSSNTTVQRFIDFLNAVDAFNYANAPIDFELSQLPLNKTCMLRHVVAPLQWISDELRQRVTPKQTQVHQLSFFDQTWSLRTTTQTYHATQVILATGAIPMIPKYNLAPIIPLEVALDKIILAKTFDQKLTYAVFGSSHSAIIVIRHLVELGAKKIINFHRSPCRYAQEMGDWILFDNTGLKGETATWAKLHIDGELPSNLVRYESSDASISQHLPLCDKVIYALGLERRKSVSINNEENLPHDPDTGRIAAGLFGLGIAYPELTTDPLGHTESSVGLWKFMVYLNRVLPLWLRDF
jgi:thioredoxin reductase